MGQRTGWLMDCDDLTRNANTYKEVFIEAMVENDYITDEQAVELSENFAIIVRHKGWLGRQWDKACGKNSPDTIIDVVKKSSLK